MSLRDSGRMGETFEIDDAVRRVLAEWSKERDSELGRMNLKRGMAKLTPPQKGQLIARLSEISLGLLHILRRSADG